MMDVITVDVNHLTKSSFYKVNVKCDCCGTEKDIHYYLYLKNIGKKNIYCCSNNCAYQLKNIQTNLEKYGVESYSQTLEYKEQYKSTCLNKYGVENVFQSEVIKDIIKKNNLEKYGYESTNSVDNVKKIKEQNSLEKNGVDHYFKTSDFKEKSKITSKKKYGVDHFINHDKYTQTCLEKYGVEHLSNIKEKRTKIKKKNRETSLIKLTEYYKNKGITIKSINFEDKTYTITCDYGHDYTISYSLLKSRLKKHTIPCSICNPNERHISGLQIQLLNFIQDVYKGEILKSSKSIIKPYELDIYLPQLKIAFEFNGVFWHDENHRPYNYHQYKLDLCSKKGIQLIYIWEDEWIEKNEIIKSKILDILQVSKKINISECQVLEIYDKSQVEEFLINNHIHGIIDSNIAIGITYHNELHSILLFNDNKIVRYCNKLNTCICDGLLYMFNFYLKNHYRSIIEIIIDRDDDHSTLFEKIGFTCIETINSQIKKRFKYNVYDSGYLKLIYTKNLYYNEHK
jgi:hypothetical protein